MRNKVSTNILVDGIDAIPGCETIRRCIQCGTCTASCPNANRMEHTPAELIAMIRAGLYEDVLTSDTMWYCLSCFMCTVRCPRGVQPATLMHTLEAISNRSGLVHSRTLTPSMYRLFNHYCRMGSLPELRFLTRFYLATNPFGALRMIPVAFNLLKRGRLSLKSRKLSTAGKRQLQAILDKAESQGEIA
jgi:heterodisulfide reductase subunit C